MTKVALVLSGGGARGIAHIGVIEELIKRGYNISSIAGTSMGAMVGGVYALSKLEEFKNWIVSIDKVMIFKMLDFSLSSHGLIKGDKILKTMKEFIDDAQIEDLNIPYSATACDLLNKEEMVFVSGSIYDAIRASISIPLIFTPVKIKNRLLVDGGIVNNIPIKNVKRSNGDILIVVNVNANIEYKPIKKKSSPNDIVQHTIYRKKIKEFQKQLKKLYPTNKKNTLGYFNILDKTINQMMFNMSQNTLKQYQPDILINISRDSCGTYDFFKAKEMIEIGRLAARKGLDDFPCKI